MPAGPQRALSGKHVAVEIGITYPIQDFIKMSFKLQAAVLT